MQPISAQRGLPSMMVMVFVGVFLLRQYHVKITGIDSTFLSPSNLNLISVHRKLPQLPAEHLLPGAQIQEGADRHITADAGKTLQV